MHTFIETAEEQGWNLQTQVNLLLAYIENQKSDEAFNDFILERVDAKNNDALGLAKALEDLSFDPKMKLFKCTIGVYQAIWSENPLTTYNAFIAAKTPSDANQKAVHLCEKTYGHRHYKLSFSSENEPVHVDHESLEEIDE